MWLLNLVEISKNLATSVLATGLLVIHNASRGGQDNEAKLTRGQQVVDPILQLGKLNIEAGRDDTTLVEAAIKMDDDLSSTMVINDFKLVNVA